MFTQSNPARFKVHLPTAMIGEVVQNALSTARRQTSHGPTSSSVFAVRALRYQLFGRVDQKILQIFRCAEAHPFIPRTFPNIFGIF